MRTWIFIARSYGTDSPDWNARVAPLKTFGDLFTLYVIERLQQKELPADKMELLKDLSAAIRARHVAEPLDAREALRLLEVAAYADVECHEVEYALRIWTLEYVARFASAQIPPVTK